VRNNPKDPRAPEALYNAGQLAWSLYKVSRVQSDLKRSKDSFQALADDYPRSSLADDALYLVGQILLKHGGSKQEAFALFDSVVRDFPNADMASKARAARQGLLAFRPKARPKIEAANKESRRGPSSSEKSLPLQSSHSSRPRATQGDWSGVDGPTSAQLRTLFPQKDGTLRLSFSENIRFRVGSLPGNERTKTPRRYYVDIQAAQIAPELAHTIESMGSALEDVRVAQFDPRTVRVVLVLERGQYAQTSFGGSGKTILIQRTLGEGATLATAGGAEKTSRETQNKHLDPAVLIENGKNLRKKIENGPDIPFAVQVGLKIKKVVIDAGHGGKDHGAVGRGGTKEKDVVLAIAKKLGPKLEALGLTVVYTRDSDRFVGLEERTTRANQSGADLFISIHANAHPHRDRRGFSTYTLDVASDRYSVRLAALENSGTTKSVSDLRLVLAELAKQSNVDESLSLARSVQGKSVATLSKDWKEVKNLGVKSALFFVLLGAKMPSVLIETSFVSNPTEEKRLASSKYQEAIAEGIAAGVKGYLSDREQLALAP